MVELQAACASPIALQLHPVLQLSNAELFELCQLNRELRIERTAHGELVIMSPTGGETSARNFNLVRQLANWAEQDGSGQGFDSSGGFVLPNGAMRSPDAAWVPIQRLRPLSSEQRKAFLPLCPDFVIELRSSSDRLQDCQAKLAEYVQQGVRLGWLVDPLERSVHIYRPGQPVEVLEDPASVSGDPELPGFVLELSKVWDPWRKVQGP